MNKIIGFGIGLFVLCCAVFVVLFLGGLASAALEIRREKKAGVPVTRPAWDNREKRNAVGGMREQLKGAWKNARHRGLQSCWCQCGPIVYFEALSSTEVAGMGCSAWEAGEANAILRHDAAGGYSRMPV